MFASALTGAAGAVREAIDGAPVVDAHAHLRAVGDLRPMSFAKLLDDSFVHLCLRTPDGSPNALGTNLEIKLETDSWQTIESIASKCATNSFYRWLLKGTFALHEVPYSELSQHAHNDLTNRIAESYERDDWLTTSL